MRTVTTLSVVVLASAGIGHAVLSGLDDDIARVDPFRDMKNRPRAGHGMNILLVGTDGRDSIGKDERQRYRLGGGALPLHGHDHDRAHLGGPGPGQRRQPAPRLLRRDAPAPTDRVSGQRHEGHPLKLNAAYAEGGPQLTVRTVEKMTRVKIDHYLEVDFASFMKTVDVVGGVEICTDQRLRDSRSGLDLPPGLRHPQGRRGPPVRPRPVRRRGSDLSRMRRQQHFLAALVERATSSGILLNPMRFRDVTRAVLGSVRADEGFGTGELLDLGRVMRNFSPSSSGSPPCPW